MAPNGRPAGYGLMDPNFRFLSLDQDDPSFSWKPLNIDRDLPRFKTMTEILTAADTDLAPVQEARRQAADVSRLVGPRHQRVRAPSTTTSRW